MNILSNKTSSHIHIHTEEIESSDKHLTNELSSPSIFQFPEKDNNEISNVNITYLK